MQKSCSTFKRRLLFTDFILSCEFLGFRAKSDFIVRIPGFSCEFMSTMQKSCSPFKLKLFFPNYILLCEFLGYRAKIVFIVRNSRLSCELAGSHQTIEKAGVHGTTGSVNYAWDTASTAFSIAWARSAVISSTDSNPTANLISSSVTPVSFNSSALNCWCVVDAG